MQKKLLITLITLQLSVFSFAQNARLSQVWTTPMHVNPALSGRFDGQGRAGFLYSWQKCLAGYDQDSVVKIPHQNYYIDFKFGKYRHIGDEEQYAIKKDSMRKKAPVEAKDETGLARKNIGYWSAALNYYNYGDNTNPLKADFISATIARHFYAKRNRYFGFGLQMAYAMGDLDETRGTAYDKEVSGGGFRYPHQNIAQTGLWKNTNEYLDFNLGAYYGMATEPVSFELGFAMYHLFYPKNSIIEPDAETELRHRVTAHSLLRLKLSDDWGFVQRNIYWGEGLYLISRTYSDSLNIVAFYSGVEFYKTNPRTNYNFNFGLYTRSFKTIMPFVNLNLGRVVNLRYSYEFPVNAAEYTANNAKRSEIVLLLTYKRYTPPGTRFAKKVNYW
jgi:hypothetical protein